MVTPIIDFFCKNYNLLLKLMKSTAKYISARHPLLKILSTPLLGHHILLKALLKERPQQQQIRSTERRYGHVKLQRDKD